MAKPDDLTKRRRIVHAAIEVEISDNGEVLTALVGQWASLYESDADKIRHRSKP